MKLNLQHYTALLYFCAVLFLSTSTALQAQIPTLKVEGKHLMDECNNKVILRGLSIQVVKREYGDIDFYKGLIDIMTNKEDTVSNSPGWYTRVIRIPVDGGVTSNINSYCDDLLTPLIDYGYVIIRG